MTTRFPELKDALWKSWDDKEAGDISQFRIMEYFRLNGHGGPLRAMLFHLLSRRFFRMLMEHKANGTLDQFLLPKTSTTHPYAAIAQYAPFSIPTAWELSSSWRVDAVDGSVANPAASSAGCVRTQKNLKLSRRELEKRSGTIGAKKRVTSADIPISTLRVDCLAFCCQISSSPSGRIARCLPT